MKLAKIAKILSVIASVMATYGVIALLKDATTNTSAMCLVLGMLLSIVSICMCGFLKALTTPFAWAKWGFVVCPFPMNLAFVAMLFLLGFYSLFFLPVFPVFKAAAEKGA